MCHSGQARNCLMLPAWFKVSDAAGELWLSIAWFMFGHKNGRDGFLCHYCVLQSHLAPDTVKHVGAAYGARCVLPPPPQRKGLIEPCAESLRVRMRSACKIVGVLLHLLASAQKCLWGEYAESLILFHLSGYTNVHFRQDGNFSKKFKLSFVAYCFCGTDTPCQWPAPNRGSSSL